LGLKGKKRVPWHGTKYILLVTQKHIDPGSNDDGILEQDLLPTYMDLNVIYIYPFEDNNDNGGIQKSIRVSDILYIGSAVEGERPHMFTVQIDTKEKIYLINCKSPNTALKWVKVVRQAITTLEEIDRTDNKCLKRNVDTIIHSYRFADLKLGELVLHDLSTALNFADKNTEHTSTISKDSIKRVKEKCSASKFNPMQSTLSRMQEDIHLAKEGLKTVEIPVLISIFGFAANQLIYTLDAFQAKRPFYGALFQEYLKLWHLRWTEYASVVWNGRNAKFDNSMILQFVELLFYQEDTINEYGMHDARYENSYNELMGTFCIRCYKRVMPMV
jgi:hypothetical protein